MSHNPSPIWNEYAEEAVLGAMLASDIAIDGALDAGLRGEHFYRSSHALIFKAILAVAEKGVRADSITVGDELRQRGSLADAGGQAIVSGLAQSMTTVHSSRHHAAIVMDSAATRRLQAAAHRIADIAGGLGDAQTKMASADAAMAEALEQAGVEEDADIGQEMAATYADLEEAHRTGRPKPRLRTGFLRLDDLMNGGMRPGQLVVVAARPGVGKSTFVQNIVQNVAQRGGRCAFYSLEMSRQEVGLRLVSSLANVPHDALMQEKFTEAQFEEYLLGKKRLEKLPITITDSGNLSTSGIRARCRRLQRAKGLKLIVVDYLQLMEGVGAENRQQDVAAISRSLKLLAMELTVPVIAVSQLSRRTEARENKRPQLSDLRDSGAIEQDADIVAFIYRDDQYNADATRGEAEIIVAKQRSGKTGTVKLTFNGHRCRFDNLGKGTPPEPVTKEAEEVFARAE